MWVNVVPIGRPVVEAKVAIACPAATEVKSKVKLPVPTVTEPVQVTS